MTTYKMPQVLGGGEVEATEEWGGCAGGRPEYQIGGITVLMPPGMPLEAVKPPLPAEPPVGGVVRADFKAQDMLDIESWVFEHGEIPAPNGNSWCGAGRDEAFSWAQICELGTPVRLVPAPEPVNLPWECRDDANNGVLVEESDVRRGQIYVDAENAHILPADAREMARALNTAADQAEREATDGVQ